MAKLSVLAAFLLVALVTPGQASAKHTTVGEVGTSKAQCQGQDAMMTMRPPCMMFLSDMSTGDEEGSPKQKKLQTCCTELQKLTTECRCDAILLMMRREREKGTWKGQHLQEMTEVAKQIPGKCNMIPQQCQFQTL